MSRKTFDAEQQALVEIQWNITDTIIICVTFELVLA